MRIYLAIPISQPILDKITEISSQHQMPGLRWLADKNLHITLVPPWESSPNNLKETIAAIRNLDLPRPFEVSFNIAKLGPNSKSPRSIMATGQAPTELIALKRDLEHVVNYRPDRALVMHITLARFNPRQTTAPPINQEIHWNMLVDKFVIMESVLRPEGADYTILETFELS